MSKEGFMFKYSLAARIFSINILFIVLPLIVYLGYGAKYGYNVEQEKYLSYLEGFTSFEFRMIEDKIEASFNELEYIALEIASTQSSEKIPVLMVDEVVEKSSFTHLAAFKKEKGTFELAYTFTNEPPIVLSELQKHVKEKSDFRLFFIYEDSTKPSNDLFGVTLIGVYNEVKDQTYYYIALKPLQEYFKLVKDSSLPPDALFITSKVSHNIIKISSKGIDININTSESIKAIDIKDGYKQWNFGNQHYVGLQESLLDSDLDLYFGLSQSYIDKHYLKLTIFSLLLIFLAIFILLLINLWIIKRLSTPFSYFSQIMQSYAKGHFSARYEAQPLGFEINDMGVAMNNMAENIENNLKFLNEEQVKSNLFANELKIGREIQNSILNLEPINQKEIEVDASILHRQYTGGEFYDIFTRKRGGIVSNKLLFTLGSSFKKGIFGSLYSFTLRSILRSSFSIDEPFDQSFLEAYSFYMMATQSQDQLVNATLFQYDLLSKQLLYAAHESLPLIVITEDNKVLELFSLSDSFGKVATPQIEVKELFLKPGDRVLAFSKELFEKISKKEVLELVIKLHKEEATPFLERTQTLLSHCKGFETIKNDLLFLTFKVNL